MGGEGSGRRPDPIKALMPKEFPVNPRISNNLVLPNLSGVRNELKQGTKQSETLILNSDVNFSELFNSDKTNNRIWLNGQNYALTGTATSSSTFGLPATTYSASKGNDGDIYNTFFLSNGVANDWWKLDLGAVRTIKLLRYWKQTGQGSRASNYKIQTSVIGDFTDAVDLVTASGETAEFIEYSVNTTARYIRIYCTGTQYLSVAEFQVFGVSAGNTYINDNLYVGKQISIPCQSSSGNSPTAYIKNFLGSFTFEIDGATSKFRLLPSGSDLYFQNTTSSGNMNFTGSQGGRLTGYFGFLGGDARFQYDTNNYLKITTSSAGAITFDAVGSGAILNFNDDVNLASGKVIKMNGTSGFTGTGAYTNFTIVGGIITNAT